ncbi:MAG: glycosyltransferase [Pseudomonadota bacterium]|nr:glycosyltransferase [Pseudomonadota bacterium]
MARLTPDAGAFTCLLPVHAGDDPDHFEIALESVLANTLAPAEILICQDGAVAAPLARAIERGLRRGARLVRNPGPSGLHHNLNHAMEEVRTPWVCRADADDVNLPTRFETQMNFLVRHPDVAVLGAGIVEFWPDGRERRKAMALTHEAIVQRARYRNPINHMTAFFRAAAFFACGGYPAIPGKEDYGLWLTMIDRRYRLANLEEVLVRARLGGDFHGRRSGLGNLASEYALFKLRRGMRGIGGPAAAAALIARASVLAFAAPSRWAYEGFLRR